MFSKPQNIFKKQMTISLWFDQVKAKDLAPLIKKKSSRFYPRVEKNLANELFNKSKSQKNAHELRNLKTVDDVSPCYLSSQLDK